MYALNVPFRFCVLSERNASDRLAASILYRSFRPHSFSFETVRSTNSRMTTADCIVIMLIQ